MENASIRAVSSVAVVKASMTAEERAHVVRLLNQSRKDYLFHVEDLSEAQWAWKPAPERWSAGQTAEHILQAEAVLLRKLQQAIQSQANPDWAASTEGKIELLESVMLDRNGKADAPAPT